MKTAGHLKVWYVVGCWANQTTRTKGRLQAKGGVNLNTRESPSVTATQQTQANTAMLSVNI